MKAIYTALLLFSFFSVCAQESLQDQPFYSAISQYLEENTLSNDELQFVANLSYAAVLLTDIDTALHKSYYNIIGLLRDTKVDAFGYVHNPEMMAQLTNATRQLDTIMQLRRHYALAWQACTEAADKTESAVIINLIELLRNYGKTNTHSFCTSTHEQFATEIGKHKEYLDQRIQSFATIANYYNALHEGTLSVDGVTQEDMPVVKFAIINEAVKLSEQNAYAIFEANEFLAKEVLALQNIGAYVFLGCYVLAYEALEKANAAPQYFAVTLPDMQGHVLPKPSDLL